MALRNLEVVVTVVDKAGKDLDKISKKVRDTGKAAKDATVDYTKFNRTLFSTAAFVGLFAKQMTLLKGSIEEGADLDRVESQYERVLGSKGILFKALENITTTGVNRFEVMKEGIGLANLGIIHSSEQLAEVMGMAGTASKLSGRDSSEGIKEISEAMKDGEVSHLQFLNIIAKTNPALQAQLAILHKAGGVMGGVISTQYRLNLIQNLLRAATKGHLQDQVDLVDILKIEADRYQLLRKEIGLTLGTALGPFIRSISNLIEKVRTEIETLRKTDKNFIPFIKNTILATGAILGLVAALGTLRLASIALGSLGLGLPVLTGIFLVLEKVLARTTDKTKKFTDILGKLSAVGKGIWQLITNFDILTGKSKISAKVLEMLGGPDSALFKLVKFIARIGIIINRTFDEIISDAKWFKDQLVSAFDKVSNLLFKSSKVLGGGLKETWSNLFVTDLPKILAKSLEVLFAIWGASKIFKLFSGFSFGNLFGGLSKVPVIGKLFGGRADGSRSNPFYVIVAGSEGLGGIGAAAAGGAMSKFPSVLGSAFQLLKNLISNLVKLPSLILAGIRGFFVYFAQAGPVLALSVAAVAGALVGTIVSKLMEKYTQGETKEGFKGDIGERALFKLSKFTGIGPGAKMAEDLYHQKEFERKSDAELLNDFRKNKGLPPLSEEQIKRLNTAPKLPGEKSVTSVPMSSPTQEAMIDDIGENIKSISDKNQRNKAAIYTEATLSALGQRGEALTPSSMEDILQSISQPQISLLSSIEENTRKNKDMAPITSRR